MPKRTDTAVVSGNSIAVIGVRDVKQMLASGKRASGEPLTEAQRTYLTDALHNLEVALPEFSQAPTLKPSLTFQDSLTIDATGIVPGHGPVMHDRTYLALLADLLEGPLHDET